jgi:hypothetical protein
MLARKTLKNQITLPKAVLRQLPDVQYFDISVRGGEIVLRPAVVTSSGDRVKAVRDKMRALGLSERDVDDAIRRVRRRRG